MDYLYSELSAKKIQKWAVERSRSAECEKQRTPRRRAPLAKNETATSTTIDYYLVPTYSAMIINQFRQTIAPPGE